MTNPATSPWAPLREPPFRALWLAVLISNIGTWIDSVATAWLDWQLKLCSKARQAGT